MPSVFRTPHDAERGPNVGLTVMTFNLFNDSSSTPGEGAIGGWMARRASVADTIREHAPDVVGLQEVFLWQLDYLLSELPDYACVGRARDAEGVDEAVPVMYRRDKFDLAESGQIGRGV